MFLFGLFVYVTNKYSWFYYRIKNIIIMCFFSHAKRSQRAIGACLEDASKDAYIGLIKTAYQMALEPSMPFTHSMLEGKWCTRI